MLREKTITIDTPGRDLGKTFKIREMPALQAEDWMTRALLLLARGGTELPDDILNLGGQGIVIVGIGAMISGLAKAPYQEIKPLLAEMLDCVVELQSPSGIPIMGARTIFSQIEEVSTIVRLREEVLSLHLNFSIAARLSEFRTLAAAMVSPGQNMPTSAEQSE